MADANNILPNNDAPDEQMMNYLQGNLSDEEMQKVQKQIGDDAFVKDALDGLQQFSSNKKLNEYVASLNQNLQQQLAIKKQKQEKRKLIHPSWIVMATVLILLLCVLAYVVIMFVKIH